MSKSVQLFWIWNKRTDINNFLQKSLHFMHKCSNRIKTRQRYRKNRHPATGHFTDWVTLIPTTRSKSFVLLRSLHSSSLHACMGLPLQLLGIQSLQDCYWASRLFFPIGLIKWNQIYVCVGGGGGGKEVCVFARIIKLSSFLMPATR
jgi:hypothetical protein